MSFGQLFLAVEQRTTAFAMWCAAGMLVLAASAGFYQIISRFVLEQPSEWTEVVVRFGLIWMVFLGIPAGFRQGAMISIDLMYQFASPRFRRVLEGLFLVTGLILMLSILWLGQDYAWRTRTQTIPGAESFTMIWAYAAMPVGAVFSIIAIIAQWLDPRHRELETAL